MRVDLRRADVAVAQEFLDRSDVVIVLQQVGRKGIPEGMAGRMLGDARPADGFLDGALDDGFVEVMAASLTRLTVDVDPGGGKTHCHGHSRPAFGYLRPSAQGSSTQPAPWARSISCRRLTDSRWRASAGFTASGKTVTRSRSPFPARTTIWLVASRRP